MHIRRLPQPKRRVVERAKGNLKDYFRQATRVGLTQQQMADDLGVTKMTLNRWLKDEGFRYASTYIEVEA